MPVQPAAVDLLTAVAPVLSQWGRWYVFGAQAVIVYGVPRLSADVDVTLALVPDALKEDYRPLFLPQETERAHWAIVKAADKICAYVKCLEEVAAGNGEFAQAEKALRASVEALPLPEARYFLETFAPSFRLTLDDLG